MFRQVQGNGVHRLVSLVLTEVRHAVHFPTVNLYPVPQLPVGIYYLQKKLNNEISADFRDYAFVEFFRDGAKSGYGYGEDAS
jgi:hypothetical protein